MSSSSSSSSICNNKVSSGKKKLYQALFGVLQLHRLLRQVALLVLQCHAQEERWIVQCESNTDVETDDMVFVVCLCYLVVIC